MQWVCTARLASNLRNMLLRRLAAVSVPQATLAGEKQLTNPIIRSLHASGALRPLSFRFGGQCGLRRQHASLVHAAGFTQDTEAVTAPEPGTPEAPPQVPPELASLEHVPSEEHVELEDATRAAAADVLESDSDSSDSTAEVNSAAAAVFSQTTVGSEVPEGELSPLAAAAATADLDTINKAFERQWDLFMAKLQEKGMFNTLDDQGNPISAAGATKRACLEVGRQRADLLFSLDPAQIKGLLNLYDAPGVTSAMDDRKCVNALKRLRASYLEGEDLGIALGGAAESVDLTRLLWSTNVTTTQENKVGQKIQLAPEYLSAAMDIIGDILVILDSAADPEAVAKAGAAKLKKEAVHERSQAPRNEYRGDQPFRMRGNDFESQDIFRPGDWECPNCQGHNFASKQACFRCGIPKPEGLRSSGGMHGDFDRGYERAPYERASYDRAPPMGAQPGDWPCMSCGASNFARRRECFQCGEPRGAASAGPGRMSDSRTRFGEGDWSGRRQEDPRPRASSGSQVKPGDWHCTACSEHNFASRSECFRCGASKQPGSEVEGQVSGSFSQRSYGGGPGRDSYGGGGDAGRSGGSSYGRGRAPSRGRASSDRGGFGSRGDSYGRSDGPPRGRSDGAGFERGPPAVRGGNFPSRGRSGPALPPPADLDW